MAEHRSGLSDVQVTEGPIQSLNTGLFLGPSRGTQVTELGSGSSAEPKEEPGRKEHPGTISRQLVG